MKDYSMILWIVIIAFAKNSKDNKKKMKTQKLATIIIKIIGDSRHRRNRQKQYTHRGPLRK